MPDSRSTGISSGPLWAQAEIGVYPMPVLEIAERVHVIHPGVDQVGRSGRGPPGWDRRCVARCEGLGHQIRAGERDHGQDDDERGD